MPRTCQISGKTAQPGNNVSHSKRHTKRRFKPNLQTKRVYNPATESYMRITLSTSALKTLAKWQEAGKHYDVRQLVKEQH